MEKRLVQWASEVRACWDATRRPVYFARLMRVRLARSRLGPLLYPRPGVSGIAVPALGGVVWLRSHSSDYGVLFELLGANEYVSLADMRDVGVIVDLGANTGLVARWLLEQHPAARIVCVEPDPGNLAVMRRNLAGYGARVEIVAACVGAREGTTTLTTDSGEWGYRMTGAPGDVQVTTMGRLIDEHSLDHIDVLKCDIEGAEREVFSRCDPWLGRVGVAVVECHGFAGDELVRPGWVISERHGATDYGFETVTLSRA